jgi:Holliday junction resolvase
MPINSKQKGKTGELELARKLKEYGYDTRRSVQYNGKDGQADVIGLPSIHIECKRVERLNLYDAMDQAKRDAKNGDRPAVFHRKSRSNWLVTMELDAFMEIYKEYETAQRLREYINKRSGNNG